jgi:hypothetical protein
MSVQVWKKFNESANAISLQMIPILNWVAFAQITIHSGLRNMWLLSHATLSYVETFTFSRGRGSFQI